MKKSEDVEVGENFSAMGSSTPDRVTNCRLCHLETTASNQRTPLPRSLITVNSTRWSVSLLSCCSKPPCPRSINRVFSWLLTEICFCRFTRTFHFSRRIFVRIKNIWLTLSCCSGTGSAHLALQPGASCVSSGESPPRLVWHHQPPNFSQNGAFSGLSAAQDTCPRGGGLDSRSSSAVWWADLSVTACALYWTPSVTATNNITVLFRT